MGSTPKNKCSLTTENQTGENKIIYAKKSNHPPKTPQNIKKQKILKNINIPSSPRNSISREEAQTNHTDNSNFNLSSRRSTKETFKKKNSLLIKENNLPTSSLTRTNRKRNLEFKESNLFIEPNAPNIHSILFNTNNSNSISTHNLLNLIDLSSNLYLISHSTPNLRTKLSFYSNKINNKNLSKNCDLLSDFITSRSNISSITCKVEDDTIKENENPQAKTKKKILSFKILFDILDKDGIINYKDISSQFDINSFTQRNSKDPCFFMNMKDLIDDKILFRGYLDKYISTCNFFYSKRYFVLFQNKIMYYSSEEKFILLDKPIAEIPLQKILNISLIKIKRGKEFLPHIIILLKEKSFSEEYLVFGEEQIKNKKDQKYIAKSREKLLELFVLINNAKINENIAHNFP